MKHTPSPYWLLPLALLPLIVLRDFTPSNELRYLSIVDEALRNGTFFTFSQQGVPYADKPPLYFWLLMLCRWLTGSHCMWLLSLFSLVPALVIASVMNRWTMREVHPTYRNTGRWMMLTTGLFLALSFILRMDMLMCMFIVLALRTFYEMLDDRRAPGSRRWLLGLYVFLALFSKGPMGLLIPLLGSTVFLLVTGRLRYWGRYWGWPAWTVLLGGCLLWFGGVWLEGGSDYLDNLLFHQTVDRAVGAFRHRQPFYYYLVTIWYMMMPWALLLLGTVLVAAFTRRYHTELQHFFLTIVVTTVVLLSCISSKLDVYLLPAYPFITYLTLMQLGRYGLNRWTALALALPAGIFILALPALAVLARRPETSWLGLWPCYAAAALLTAGGIAALWQLYGRRHLNGAIAALTAGLLAALFAGGFALPRLNAYMGYGTLCRHAMEISERYGATDIRVYQMRRTTGMDVYLGRTAVPVTEEEVGAGLPPRTLLMTRTAKIDPADPTLKGRCRWTSGPYTLILY